MQTNQIKKYHQQFTASIDITINKLLSRPYLA